jgi:hypothetical protein
MNDSDFFRALNQKTEQETPAVEGKKGAKAE